MPENRITDLRIQGVRTLADAHLQLGGLTVLIGDNGTGKSSLVEAAEVLRLAAGPRFFAEVDQAHGGVAAMLRQGAPRLALEAGVDGSAGALRYRLAVTRYAVEEEDLIWSAAPGADALRVLARRGTDVSVVGEGHAGRREQKVNAQQPALTMFGSVAPHPAIARMIRALEGIDVHLAFDAASMWNGHLRGGTPAMRESAAVRPVEALSCLGSNLANAYFALRNERPIAHWQETMDYVRIGLGPRVTELRTRADPGGNRVGLWVHYDGMADEIPAAALSDGTLAYLAFVALFRLEAPSTLIVIDEPESHLHPSLLVRVLDLCRSLAVDRPVVLATHSDRLLDALPDPATSVVLCELDDRLATRLLRPDPPALQRWLARYRGVGDLRATGLDRGIWADPEQR